MVESEVKIRVRLEMDEGDKSAIRNQAKAIKETGTAPIQNNDEPQEFRGGIFGDTQEPDVKGFEKRQAIGGAVKGFKDKTSKQATQRTSVIDDLKEEIKGNENNIASVLGLENFEAKNILEFAGNPQGSFLKIFSSVGKAIPVIGAITSAVTAALAAPEIFKGLVEKLTQRGGPMSRFFQREILRERNPFRSRQQQKLIQIGESQIITTQARGFSNSGSNLTSNTLSQVRANGISDIGLRDKAEGLF